MREIIVYGMAATNSLILLAYTVHMFVGGLVSERTENIAKIDETGIGAIAIALLARRAISIRLGEKNQDKQAISGRLRGRPSHSYRPPRLGIGPHASHIVVFFRTYPCPLRQMSSPPLPRKNAHLRRDRWFRHSVDAPAPDSWQSLTRPAPRAVLANESSIHDRRLPIRRRCRETPGDRPKSEKHRTTSWQLWKKALLRWVYRGPSPTASPYDLGKIHNARPCLCHSSHTVFKNTRNNPIQFPVLLSVWLFVPHNAFFIDVVVLWFVSFFFL